MGLLWIILNQCNEIFVSLGCCWRLLTKTKWVSLDWLWLYLTFMKISTRIFFLIIIIIIIIILLKRYLMLRFYLWVKSSTGGWTATSFGMVNLLLCIRSFNLYWNIYCLMNRNMLYSWYHIFFLRWLSYPKQRLLCWFTLLLAY